MISSAMSPINHYEVGDCLAFSPTYLPRYSLCSNYTLYQGSFGIDHHHGQVLTNQLNKLLELLSTTLTQ